ncbi:MAG: hypothetical protein JNL83_17585, partial [Myxococcales bacterium]|nr:hypothetical protein [Myxococcales bacterium]
MNQSRPILRIVDADVDVAFASAAVSHSTTIPILRVMKAAEPAPEPALEPAPSPIPVLPATSGVPAEDTQPGRSITGRMFALVLIAATVTGLGWLGTQIYYVLTDGWVAPLHLSPDSDQVQNLRLANQRYVDELSRIDAEVVRLDGEIAAIDSAIAKLSSLRGNSTEMIKWQAETSRVDAAGLSQAREIMRRQYALLKGLHQRQLGLVARARADLAAGLVDRTALDREEQQRDQLALEMTALERQ